MSELKITGNPTPTVGKAEFYSVNQSLSSAIPTKIFDGSKPNAFEYPVEWSVHILENGRWIQKEENDKTGNKVSYTFIQKSLERKGIRILAKRGNQVARLDIKPHKAESPKIDSIEFLDRNGNKPTKPFAYGQTLKARVHCLHMERRTIYATLWEDDAAGAGHNKANEKNKMKTLPGTVKGGIADIDFVLEPDFAKIANAIKAKGDADEGKTHEYYVTAEILNKKTASANTNVANPSYKDTTAKPATPKKETPAQKKGPSKKQEKEKEKEKSIGDDIIDWWEGLFKVKPIVAPNPKAPTGNNPLKTGEPDKNPKEDKKEDNKNGVCESEARVRAFMRMLRIGEDTKGEAGYTTAFGGNKITDLSTHPKKNYGGSTAAGAYQIMKYTYAWLGGSKLEWTGTYFKILDIYEKEHDYIKKYNITDYKPESQDKLCICLMKDKKGMIELIVENKTEEAIRKYGSSIWASLPYKGDNSRYDFKGKPQPATAMKKCLSDYNIFLKEELGNKSDLHLKKGFLKEFGYNCCDGHSKTSPKTDSCDKCQHKHYDVAKIDKWITQKPHKCWDASVQILKNYGITGGARTNSIITVDQNKTVLTVLNAKQGLDYIDSQLKIGKPVVVGLDDNLRQSSYNAHKATDHFFVIVGKDCEKGKIYYNFFDVGSKTVEEGTSKKNRLYLHDNLMLKGKSYGGSHNYTVTEVRRNN